MKKKIIIFFAAAVPLLLTFSVISLIVSKFFLKVSTYTVEGDIKNEISAVLLSDLHGSQFGKDNNRLIEKINGLKPDAVFIVGDFLNNFEQDFEPQVSFVKELCKNYPVYFSYGNHEKDWESKFNTEVDALFEDAGATVLELEYTDTEIAGVPLRIGGMYSYAFATDNLNSTNPDNMDPDVYSFLCEFEDTKLYKIMLCHMPDSFIFGQAAATWDIDLVLSGHTHGGQVVLPFFGGLWAGDQGFFPEYVHGFYEKENIKMVITSGLGSSKQALPRFNNPPEIAKIIITPKVGG